MLKENAEKDQIVVIKIYAGFCRACKAFDRKFRLLSLDFQEQGANVKFFEMDWMKTRDLCKSLQVGRGYSSISFGRRMLFFFFLGWERVGRERVAKEIHRAVTYLVVPIRLRSLWYWCSRRVSGLATIIDDKCQEVWAVFGVVPCCIPCDRDFACMFVWTSWVQLALHGT